MGSTSPANPQIPESWRLPTLGVWLTLAGLTLIMLTLSVPARYENLLVVSPNADPTLGQLLPVEADALQSLGLTPRFYAAYFTGLETFSGLIFFVVAAIIFLRRAGHRVAFLFALALLPFGTIASPLLPALVKVDRIWGLPTLLLQVIGVGGFLLAMFRFPDGRFIPGWTRWVAYGWLAYTLSWFVLPEFQLKMTLIPVDGRDAMLKIAFFSVGLLVMVTQVYRYQRASTATQRQQTKWAIYGILVALGLAYVVSVPLIVFPSLAAHTPAALVYRMLAFTVVLFGEIAIASSIALALLRYRLWEVDLVIRRTLVYGALTGTLAAIYLFGILVITTLVPAQGSLATVLTTLAIAALFSPLRRRIQRDIDRLFYRQKYDGERILSAFSAGLRDEVDLDQLSGSLLQAVTDCMQPSHLSLWIRNTEEITLERSNV